jgi:hypothetical protein
MNMPEEFSIAPLRSISFAAILTFISANAAAQTATDVNVVNVPSVRVTNPLRVSFPETVPVTGNVTATIPSGVKITNPSTAPVLASHLEDPGRIPYQSDVAASAQCPYQGIASQQCVASFAAVPAGKRLVIQNISLAFIGALPSDMYFAVNVTQNSVNHGFLTRPTTASAVVDNEYVFAQSNTTLYADPGPVYLIVRFHSPNPLFPQTFALTGYEIDCTAAPCAPIVN